MLELTTGMLGVLFCLDYTTWRLWRIRLLLGDKTRAMLESCIALSIGDGPSSRYSPAEVALHSSGNSHFNPVHSTPLYTSSQLQ
jgi:hypothetical protein